MESETKLQEVIIDSESIEEEEKEEREKCCGERSKFHYRPTCAASGALPVVLHTPFAAHVSWAAQGKEEAMEEVRGQDRKKKIG